MVVVTALLAGAAVSVDLGGREFVVSWIDLAAAVLAVVAAVVVVRRRRVRLDVALGAYGAVLAVVVVQAALLPQPLEILGGSSRFVTAALVLASLTVLGVGRWWREVLVGWGAVLGAWVIVTLLLALADPALTSFYAVKNAVVTPLGASNTLGGYLVVPAAAGAVLASRDRRLVAPTAVAALGVVATLSRGAVAALVLAVVITAVVARTRRLGLVAVVGAATTVAVGAGLTLAAHATDPLASSTDGRLALWRAAVRGFLDHPVLGVGLNRITTITAGLRQPHDHAHNLFLQALAESGLLGDARVPGHLGGARVAAVAGGADARPARRSAPARSRCSCTPRSRR